MPLHRPDPLNFQSHAPEESGKDRSIATNVQLGTVSWLRRCNGRNGRLPGRPHKLDQGLHIFILENIR
jgi:hypothetical protein